MPKSLLLADDSITIQRVVNITFANEDFAITTTDNGEDAIAKARELRPDIVLADVIMPKKNGYEVAQAVKSDPNLRHIPVLLLAGTFEAFDENRAREAGANGHITKPFESQALIDKVNELLAQAAGEASAPQPVPVAPPQPVARPAAPTPIPVQPTPIAPRPIAPTPIPVQPIPRPVAPTPISTTPTPVAPRPITPTPIPMQPTPMAPKPIAPTPIQAQPAPVAPRPIAPTPIPVQPAPIAPKPIAPTPIPAQPVPIAPRPIAPTPIPAQPVPIAPKPMAPMPIPTPPQPAAPTPAAAAPFGSWFESEPPQAEEPSQPLNGATFSETTAQDEMPSPFGPALQEEEPAGAIATEPLEPEPLEPEPLEPEPLEPEPLEPEPLEPEEQVLDEEAPLREPFSLAPAEESLSIDLAPAEDESKAEEEPAAVEPASLAELAQRSPQAESPALDDATDMPAVDIDASGMSDEATELAPMHDFIPRVEEVGGHPIPTAAKPLAPEPLPIRTAPGLPREEIEAMTREIIERVVWDVVPKLAETILREEIEKLVREKMAD